MGGWRASKTGVLTPSTSACPPSSLDTLLIGLYVLADDCRGPGRPPQITDAELLCLAVAQMLLDCPGDRRLWPSRATASGTCFRDLPKQLAYNKRPRPGSCARSTSSCSSRLAFCDELWLVDGTPVPCGSRARPPGARSRPAMPPTDGAARTPVILGISPRAGLRARRDACGLRTSASARSPRRSSRRRAHHPGRQGLRGPRLRSHGRADGRTTGPTARTNHDATASWARPASGSNRSSTPSRPTLPRAPRRTHHARPRRRPQALALPPPSLPQPTRRQLGPRLIAYDH